MPQKKQFAVYKKNEIDRDSQNIDEKRFLAFGLNGNNEAPVGVMRLYADLD